MTDRQKQLALLIGGLLLVGLVFFAVYYFFFTGAKTTEPASTLPNTSGTQTIPTTVTTKPNTGTGEQTTPQEPTLFQIHDKPIVSFVVFVRKDNSYARFIEQGSGHVYEYNFDTKQKIRISNTSIPQIATATWARDGNTVVFQYLETGITRTAVGELATTSTEGSYKKITFLPAGLGTVALSPDGAEVAYTTTNQSGGVVVVSKKDGTSPRTVFTSPLTRWLISWPSKDNLLVETPLSQYGGIAYSINVRSGAQKTLTATAGPFSGLTGASDGISYLYSPSWARGITRLNSKDNTEYALFSMNTIPDKCSFMATSTDYAICGVGSGAGAAILYNLEGWLRGEGLVRDTVFIINYRLGYWTPPIRAEDQGDRVFDVEHIEANARLTFAAFKELEGETLWGIFLRKGLIL